MLQEPLTCDSSFMLPTCFPYSPPRSPTHLIIVVIINRLKTAKGFHSFDYHCYHQQTYNSKRLSFLYYHGCHQHTYNSKKISFIYYLGYHQQTENSKKLSFISLSLLSSTVVDAKPIRGNVRRNGRMYPEHVERSFLHPEYSFVAVRRILYSRSKCSPS